MKTKKILVEMPVDWEEQLSTVNYAWIGKKLYEILRRSPVVEPCEDAISREDALMCMTGEYPADQKYEPEDIISKHIKRIKALPSVTPKQSGWIPVSERLPEEYMLDTSSCSDYVLITTEWGDGSTDIGIDRIVDGKWILSILDDGDAITAWMPLPYPYKAESEEQDADSN